MAVAALQCDLLETFEAEVYPAGASRYVERALCGARFVKLFWLGLFSAGVVDGIAVLGFWKRAILALNLLQMLLIVEHWAG